MEIIKHFTATTIIVYQNKVLLHLHKKLNFWVPVGGHIEANELPQEAARREAKEESGLEVELYYPEQLAEMGNEVKELYRPMHLLLENIGDHQHIDFIYYATTDSDVLKPQDGETANLKWFTAAEVREITNAPENTKMLSLEALELLGRAE
jgi:ADP-ribose pyrophosphatase YjhB (NUDIX family)